MINSSTLCGSDIDSVSNEDEERFGRTRTSYATLESARRDNVEIQYKTFVDLRPKIKAELSCWPGVDQERALAVVECCFDLLREADGGSLITVAPMEQLQRLQTQSADNGYMTHRLKRLSVSSPEFRRIFLDFASHKPELEHDDRWPYTYWDEAARGLPKDGGMLLCPDGKLAKGAVKILGLPLAPVQWSGHGTRHEAALGVAAFLEHAVVMIRSTSGLTRCILALQEGRIAHELLFDREILPGIAENKSLPTTVSSEIAEPKISRERFTRTSIEIDEEFNQRLGRGHPQTSREMVVNARVLFSHMQSSWWNIGLTCKAFALLMFLVIAFALTTVLGKSMFKAPVVETTTTAMPTRTWMPATTTITTTWMPATTAMPTTTIITTQAFLPANKSALKLALRNLALRNRDAKKHGDINTWDLSLITDMSNLFGKKFNQDISRWNVGSVTTMSSLFGKAKDFNHDISRWNVGRVLTMNRMFHNAESFNGNLCAWNVGKVTDMQLMFFSAKSFNGDLSRWDVSSVEKMPWVFDDAASFNSDLSTWNVANVRDMEQAFRDARSFNGDLDAWNVSSVTKMSHMFHDARSFNGNLSTWNVSNVVNMHGMFWDAKRFNGDVSTWNVAHVTKMALMFNGASVFNGDLNAWNVKHGVDQHDMFLGAPISPSRKPKSLQDTWATGNSTVT